MTEQAPSHSHSHPRVAHHAERHFTGGEFVRDSVLGMADGLTVPFALAAGLTGAIDSTAIIVTAGAAEIAAGSIAMGLGGYLAARSQAEHYARERRREQSEVRDKPTAEMAEITEIFEHYGITAEESAPVVSALRRQPQAWIVSYSNGLPSVSSVTRQTTPSSVPPYEKPADFGRSENHAT